MAQDRFRLRNTSQDPSVPKSGLKGFTLRPEVGGRVLAPRAVRMIARAEITAALLVDIGKFREMGLVSFTREFGPTIEVDIPALAAELRIELPVPAGLQEALKALAEEHLTPIEVLFPPDRTVGVSSDVIVDDELVHFEDTPAVEAVAELAHFEAPPATEPVVPPVPATPSEDEVPVTSEPEGESDASEDTGLSTSEVLDALLADVPSEEPETGIAVVVYSRAALDELSAKDLDKILVEQFAVDPKALYKIGPKAKKVLEVLKLQGTPVEE